MKALFVNHQRAYLERVLERDYQLPASETDPGECDGGSSTTSRSWNFEGNLDAPEEDFILKNIQNASRPARSAAVRSHLSVAQVTPLSKVPSPA